VVAVDRRNFLYCLSDIVRDAAAARAGGAAVGWSDIVHRYLFNTQMYLLCVGTCMLLLAFHAQPPLLRRSLRWLAAMGRMRYELYLSHMCIVLATVAGYRALLGSQQAWTFAVYLPVLACCYVLARQLERGAARLLPPR
jgi:peptidoglycan/LPS O-acetylase OafA/YrhL